MPRFERWYAVCPRPSGSGRVNLLEEETMIVRSVVVLATLLLALPASAQQEQFEAATRATAEACVEFLDQERLPECVLALQRQVMQLQAVVLDRQARIRSLEEAVRLLSEQQQEMAALGHCHDWQPECEGLLQEP